jgi:2-polyprenyl-3-methyl-5-hydroxy-6-metoxy-1,4-benzoquinol methylase
MDDIPQAQQRFVERQLRKRHLAAAWAALAGLRPGMAVLDVGCGPGILSAEYAALTGLAGIVYALDSFVVLHVPAPNLVALRQDAAEAIFLSGPPDIVFLTDTLHHALDQAAILRNLRATCGPATRMLVAEYDPAQPGRFGPVPARRIAPKTVLALLEAAGFQPGPVLDAPDEHYAVLATIL